MTTVIERKTYCRICEAMCGLKVQVENGRITEVRESRDHVLSGGHLCAKAQAASEVSYDPDRVLHPLKRNASSDKFEHVSWEQAYSDIAKKLKEIQGRYGRDALATYAGNPMAFASGAQLWWSAFKKVMGVRWAYGVGSEDTVAPMVAASMLYGSLGHLLKPDLWRSDFVLVMGANPYVSHSSLFTEPKLREAFSHIKKRGGRVVVVDPRRTETARRNEYLAINAGTDAYLLLAMLQTLIVEDRLDADRVQQQVLNVDKLANSLTDFTSEKAAEHTGIDAQQIRQLARDFAKAKSACVIGRTGTCTQRYGTLSNLLLNALCLLTGNVDSEGGMLFGDGLVDLEAFLEKSGGNTYGQFRSRTTGQIEVAQHLPSSALPSDILEPGEGQVRALFVVAGNPMLNSPAGGPGLEQALQDLELHVSLDCYINETNRLADYILPTTTMYEREDMPMFGMDAMLRPSIWVTEAVAEPQGEVKQEWQILNELCQVLGYGGCYESKLLRGLARVGITVDPRRMFDLIIRTSRWGDRFGLRPGGLNFGKLLKEHPDGVTLLPHLPIGKFSEKISTYNGRVDLGQEGILREIDRLRHEAVDHPDFPYRLIGQREMLSQNSWLHNVDTTMNKSREQTAKVHPKDGRRYGLSDGDVAKIESPWGEVCVKVALTEDMKPGNIALPHGWGHKGGGWHRANRAGGVSANLLASDRPEDCEPISGGSILNGIPVRLALATVG